MREGSDWISPIELAARSATEFRLTQMILHFVDGTYELFRHFYGMAGLTKAWTTPRAFAAWAERIEALRLLELCEKAAGRCGHEIAIVEPDETRRAGF